MAKVKTVSVADCRKKKCPLLHDQGKKGFCGAFVGRELEAMKSCPKGE